MDPISDFFTQIKNGYHARKDAVVIPYSKVKEEIANILEERKYISGFEKKGRKIRKFLEVRLAYDGNKPVLNGIKRLSKSSRRLYIKKGEIRPVKQGFGVLIISTSRGLMTGDNARKAGLGGEMIAEVW